MVTLWVPVSADTLGVPERLNVTLIDSSSESVTCSDIEPLTVGLASESDCVAVSSAVNDSVGVGPRDSVADNDSDAVVVALAPSCESVSATDPDSVSPCVSVNDSLTERDCVEDRVCEVVLVSDAEVDSESVALD